MNYLISYGLYWVSLAFNPRMDNVVFRVNVDGIKRFSWRSVLEMTKSPFKNMFMWRTEFWDINWVSFTFIIGSAMNIVGNVYYDYTKKLKK